MFSRRIVLSVFILLFHFNFPAFAINSSENLSQAEKYVLEQLQKGKRADFRNIQEEFRILSPNFLKKLLTGALHGVEVTEKGINIYGAIIKEKLVLSKHKISFPVSLVACIFVNDIDFSQTTFSGRTSFSFTTFSKKASFSRAKFASTASFHGTKFAGTASFSNAEFLEKVSFAEAQFSEKAFFSTAKFSKNASFWRAKFSKSASFSWAKFSGAANFSEADFIGKVSFSGAKFSEKAIFLKANLQKADLRKGNLRKADLSHADLREANLDEADLKGCKFWDAKLPLIFEPKAGSPPYIPSIAGFPNLSALTYRKSPHALVDLREGFKKFGYRRQEREITYAIKHTQRRNLLKFRNKELKDTEDTEKTKEGKKFSNIWENV